MFQHAPITHYLPSMTQHFQVPSASRSVSVEHASRRRRVTLRSSCTRYVGRERELQAAAECAESYPAEHRRQQSMSLVRLNRKFTKC